MCATVLPGLRGRGELLLWDVRRRRTADAAAAFLCDGDKGDLAPAASQQSPSVLTVSDGRFDLRVAGATFSSGRDPTGWTVAVCPAEGGTAAAADVADVTKQSVVVGQGVGRVCVCVCVVAAAGRGGAGMGGTCRPRWRPAAAAAAAKIRRSMDESMWRLGRAASPLPLAQLSIGSAI